MDFISLFGTGASVIIAISLTMKNIRRLRILNALGAIAFTVYGALIGAVPVYALNGFIVFIDLYYLWKMKAQRDRFDVIESDPYASPYVNLFLEHYKKDIGRYQPEFTLEKGKGWLTEFILRDLNPVSIIIYRRLDEHTVEIGLDYAVPSYRDFKSAEYYFNKASERIAAGSSLTFYQASAVTEHQRYLERLGFEPVETSPGGLKKYRKVIAGR